MHPYFQVLGLTIPAYGVMMLSAALLGFVILYLLLPRSHVPKSDAINLFLLALAGGLVGAFSLRPIMKIVEIVLHYEKFATLPLGQVVHWVFGEAVFLGGLIGAMAIVVFYCKKFRVPLLPVLDLAACVVPVMHAVGRVGCLFAGCSYGQEVSAENPFAIRYPDASLGAPPEVPLLAVPVIEAVCLLFIEAVCLLLFLRKKRSGFPFVAYLAMYAVLRFVLEFYRGDAVRGILGVLSTSQWLCIGLLVAACGIAGYIIKEARRTKTS